MLSQSVSIAIQLELSPLFSNLLALSQALEKSTQPVEHDQKTTTSKPLEKPNIAGLG
jgi:hypothetical protein